MIWTLKNFPSITDKRLLDVPLSQQYWRSDFEDELRQQAIRLLQVRAGGRLSMFEAGLLYQICLVLGLEDSRAGKMFEQEEYWNEVVLSCTTEEEAKEILDALLKGEKVKTRNEKIVREKEAKEQK